MRDSPKPARNPVGRRIFQAVLLAAAISVCSVLATWRSYAYSDSLTVADATVSTDEGLLSLQIPLVRRAPGGQMVTQWITYKRGKDMWETGDGGGKTRLRYWMTILDTARCEGGMLGGFGYWKGAWQSSSRPGPFIVMFVPIWVAITSMFMLIAILYLRRMRFRLATMLMGTAMISVILWLLTLQAPLT
jgi:hypothetical protein